jgi:hypothetical protein
VELSDLLRDLVRDAVREVIREELDARLTDAPGIPVSQARICSVLHVSRKTLRVFVREGMPEIRLGAQSPRYDLAACAEWIRKRSGLTP